MEFRARLKSPIFGKRAELSQVFPSTEGNAIGNHYCFLQWTFTVRCLNAGNWYFMASDVSLIWREWPHFVCCCWASLSVNATNGRVVFFLLLYYNSILDITRLSFFMHNAYPAALGLVFFGVHMRCAPEFGQVIFAQSKLVSSIWNRYPLFFECLVFSHKYKLTLSSFFNI